MPKGIKNGEGPPVVHVVLECTHIRRFFERTTDDKYYCFECDERKNVHDILEDPRARPGGNGKKWRRRTD